jgi:hypothetical protein
MGGPQNNPNISPMWNPYQQGGPPPQMGGGMPPQGMGAPMQGGSQVPGLNRPVMF